MEISGFCDIVGLKKCKNEYSIFLKKQPNIY